MPFKLTQDALDILIEMDDETFIQFLVDMVVNSPPDDLDFSLLYQNTVLFRLGQVYTTRHDLWLGQLVPMFRQHRAFWYPEFEAKVKAYCQQRMHDPFAWTDVRTLLDRPLLPLRWLVPGLIPDGLTLLGGTPKSGKSYLAYTLAVAVASTGLWGGHFEVDPGKVLFISLEDDPDDTRQRLAEIDPDCSFSPARFLFLHGQQVLPGFAHGLQAWLQEALTLYQPRLVVIDPISYLYQMKRGPTSLFEETKDALFPLRWLAKQHQCAIVCLDHRRKRSKEDVSIFDTLHGSQAKIAVADSILMVEREQSTVTMAALLRRGQDQTHFFDLAFAEGRMWCTYKGAGASATHQDATYGDIRIAVMRTLASTPDPLSLEELALAADLPTDRAIKQVLWQILFRMQKNREVVKVGKNRYALSTGGASE